VVTADEAREQLAAFAPQACPEQSRRACPEQSRRAKSETIPVIEACGRVLAKDLVSPTDLPHFHRANMDGYAVRAQDTFGASSSLPAYLKLVGVIEMGKEARRPLKKGEIMRISTGGMLPPGADAVVMVEYTEEMGDGTVEIQRGVSPWENVIRIGEDIKKGDAIFKKGRRLRAHDLGALTGVGLTKLLVYGRPRVALISTGDEVVDPAKAPKPGQVRNVNQYSLRAMIAECGGETVDFGVIKDDRPLWEKTLAKALTSADIVMISGGSSVGTKDMTVDVICSFPNSEMFFHGISIAPGKPTIFAKAMAKPVMGLPGHPVSALVVFELFGGPLVRMVGGESPTSAFAFQRTVRAVLTQNVASAPGREDYVRVALERRGAAPQTCPELGRRDGHLRARPLPGKSGAIFNLVKADGLVCIPLSDEGLEAGEEVEVILF
jgi:molybdopterin molybdotransferase